MPSPDRSCIELLLLELLLARLSVYSFDTPCEGKATRVLEGTDGIAEHLRKVIGMVEKETGAIMCCDADSQK